MHKLSKTDEVTLRTFVEEATKYIKHFRHMQPTPDENQVLLMARMINTYAHVLLPIKEYSDGPLHDALVFRANDMIPWLSMTNTGLTHIINEYRTRFNNYITLAHRDIISAELHKTAIKRYRDIAFQLAQFDALERDVLLTDDMVEKRMIQLMEDSDFDPNFIPTVAQPVNPNPPKKRATKNEPSVGINQFILASEKKS